MLKPLLASLVASVALSSSVHAVVYGGIEFPDGAVSFADTVVSYDPNFTGGPAPTDPDFMDATAALGIPDYNNVTGAVSLGRGGRIVLEFTDNFLTGSNSGAADLHIFEVGPQIEDTAVDISKDGTTWFSLGEVTGSTSSIDIDAFGYSSADLFRFVRLTDDRFEGGTSGSTVGADIDAVGAITTVRRPPAVPDTGSTLLLAAMGLAGLIGLRRRFLN